jgi:hypothetical protein
MQSRLWWDEWEDSVVNSLDQICGRSNQRRINRARYGRQSNQQPR